MEKCRFKNDICILRLENIKEKSKMKKEVLCASSIPFKRRIKSKAVIFETFHTVRLHFSDLVKRGKKRRN